jgi:hypothetical protein
MTKTRKLPFVTAESNAVWRESWPCQIPWKTR